MMLSVARRGHRGQVVAAPQIGCCVWGRVPFDGSGGARSSFCGAIDMSSNDDQATAERESDLGHG